MNIIVHWGNLDQSAYASLLSTLLEKNVSKIKRIFNKLDTSTFRVEFYLKYDESKKSYNTVIHLLSPVTAQHISEHGFTLEESFTKSVKDLRRRIRKEKEKKITLKRSR